MPTAAYIGFALGAVFGLIIGILGPSDTLKTLADSAQILIAVTALFAVFSYTYQKKKDKVDAVIKLLEFTREKIIPRTDDVAAILMTNGINMGLMPHAKIYDFDIQRLRKEHPAILAAQVRAYYVKVGDGALKINDLANLYEEFALRALNQSARKIDAMRSIMPIFVIGVEKIVAYILLESMVPGNGQFPGIRELYGQWRDDSCVVREGSVVIRNAHISQIISAS